MNSDIEYIYLSHDSLHGTKIYVFYVSWYIEYIDLCNFRRMRNDPLRIMLGYHFEFRTTCGSDLCHEIFRKLFFSSPHSVKQHSVKQERRFSFIFLLLVTDNGDINGHIHFYKDSRFDRQMKRS